MTKWFQCRALMVTLSVFIGFLNGKRKKKTIKENTQTNLAFSLLHRSRPTRPNGSQGSEVGLSLLHLRFLHLL